MFKVSLLVLFFWSAISFAEDSDPNYVGEMHPPTTVDINGHKGAVFFLRNNLKDELTSHVGFGEMYFFQFYPLRERLEYVWKLEDQEIVSVFLLPRDSSADVRKMFVLSRTPVKDSLREGYIYAVSEFTAILDQGELSLKFFPGDGDDPNLQDCFDGEDKILNARVVCRYKSAEEVKMYMVRG